MERKRETIDVLNIPIFTDSICKIDLVTLCEMLKIEEETTCILMPCELSLT